MTGVDVFIFAAVGVGICFAAYNFAVIQRTKVNPGPNLSAGEFALNRRPGRARQGRADPRDD